MRLSSTLVSELHQTAGSLMKFMIAYVLFPHDRWMNKNSKKTKLIRTKRKKCILHYTCLYSRARRRDSELCKHDILMRINAKSLNVIVFYLTCRVFLLLLFVMFYSLVIGLFVNPTIRLTLLEYLVLSYIISA